MTISSNRKDLFRNSTIGDKLNLFQLLFDAKELSADLTLALLKIIHDELSIFKISLGTRRIPIGCESATKNNGYDGHKERENPHRDDDLHQRKSPDILLLDNNRICCALIHSACSLKVSSP